MTNQEIEVIRKALDTEVNHKDYVKHVTEAKTILNKIEAAISVTHCCGDVVCGNCDGYGYTVDENGRRKDHCKECD